MTYFMNLWTQSTYPEFLKLETSNLARLMLITTGGNSKCKTMSKWVGKRSSDLLELWDSVRITTNC